jgi:predicted nucleotidyltransferase
MVPFLSQHLDEIRATCRRHSVVRLELFGSAVDAARFEAERSDVDLIVHFARGKDLGPWLKTYFDLREDLQRVLGRPVDLVMSGAAADLVGHTSRELVYAAADAEAA